VLHKVELFVDVIAIKDIPGQTASPSPTLFSGGFDTSAFYLLSFVQEKTAFRKVGFEFAP
jgi:hypothetical protein